MAVLTYLTTSNTMTDFVVKVNQVIDKFDNYNTAAKIPVVPFANIASTNVQDAMAEMNNEIYTAVGLAQANVATLTTLVNSLSTQVLNSQADSAALAIALG
jgi:ADP-dependent phosphofructokinase/glucokinase